ncbi:MAG: hypothetical protein Kow00107_07720 [Planctomycetota bacterium]
MTSKNPFFFGGALADVDPMVSRIIKAEEERQQRKLILIASESISPKPVREATANVFSNIYAEGYPALRMYEEERTRLEDFPRQLALLRRYQDRRFYKGTEFADFIEALAIRRAQELFATDKYPNHPNPTAPHEIFVNVQPLSGAAANNAVYNAFLKPGDVILGLALPHGGHLTHGSEYNRSGKTYNVVHYEINPVTGKLDYDAIRSLALEHRPRLIIAGASAYPWEMDFVVLRDIADETGAILLADIAHPAGLMVTGNLMSPIGLADVVTTTTHKTLCGPRGAIILTTNHEHAAKIDMGVFPGEQGGPHLNQIAGKAVSFGLDNTDDYRELMRLVKENCKALGDSLVENGLHLAYGGSQNHLLLVDLRKIKSPTGYPLTGEMASRILDLIGLTCNKNTIAGDTDAAHPGAIRIGTTWITQRGLRPEHMPVLGEIIAKALKNIYTFRYIESKGNVGRGKIPFGLFEELKHEVERLVAAADSEIELPEKSGYPFYQLMEKPADHYDETSGIYHVRGYELVEHYGDADSEISTALAGAALVECPHHGVLRVSGDRARAGLQEICTANILDLHPWSTIRTFILDSDGNVIDDVELVREESEGDEDSYLVISRGSRAGKVKAWLRALSDCYVVTDPQEVFAKVEGPFIVNDLSCPANGALRVLNLFGAKSVELLAKFDPRWKSISNGCAIKDSEGTIAFQAPFGAEVRVVVVGSEQRLNALKSRLISAGAILCGVGVMANARKNAGLPVYLRHEGDLKGADFVSTHPDMFKLTKCNYVGWRTLPTPEIEGNPIPFTWENRHSEPLKSVLYDEHIALKAKMVPFAGWTMPVWYTSTGEEHAACRESAALFDVTHMGVLDFIGENAIRFLDQVTTNYVHWLRDGQGHYSYLLGPDGVPIDDILLYRINRTHFLMVVNAANADKDEEWLRGVNSGKYIIDNSHPYRKVEANVTIRNLKNVEESGADARVDIAFQGPMALETLLKIAGDLDFRKRIYRLKRFNWTRGMLAGVDAIVARTGYTGEDVGYEIYVHPDNAAALWKAILRAGSEFGVKPAGLGARDSLRTEAGLPLYGHELAGPFGILPIEAGYGFAVRLHKPWFVGRDAMLNNEKNRRNELIRFRATSKGTRMLNLGDPVLDAQGTVIGHVTSAVAVAGIQYGIAYVSTRYTREGSRIFCYPTATLKGEPKGIKELKQGDRSVVPVECEIVPRFLRREDTSYPIIINWSKYSN